MRKFDGGLFIHINGTNGKVDVHHTIKDADAAHREGGYQRTMRYDPETDNVFGCRDVYWTDAAVRYRDYTLSMGA